MATERRLYVGPSLRRLRRDLGLTQADMAEDLQVSASYIALLERNHRPLSAEMLVRLAQTYPGKFGFVASVIGLLDFPRAEDLPAGQNYRVPTQRFTADPAVWAKMNPIHAVEALRGSVVTLVLATQGFELTMNENFLAALAAHGQTARVHRLEGGHEFSVVERAVPLVLADARRFFENP
jgi:transcriptional regulator with XRE-family HTH domain